MCKDEKKISALPRPGYNFIIHFMKEMNLVNILFTCSINILWLAGSFADVCGKVSLTVYLGSAPSNYYSLLAY